MNIDVFLFIWFLVTLATGRPESSSLQVEWSSVVAIVSFLFNFFLGIMLWLLNRKHGVDQDLRSKNKEQLDLVFGRVHEQGLVLQQAVTQVDNFRRELTALQISIGDMADDADLVDMRGDLRAVKRDLDDSRITLAGHQNACADRFVHRTIYSEDQRAMQRTVGVVHELLKQQSAIIEKIRS